MIKKYWFIFSGDHHLGPFSFEQMLEKMNNDELDPEQLVWQEGDSKWLPFFHHPRVQALVTQQEAEDEEIKRQELERLEREKKRKERELELQIKFKKIREKEALKKKPKEVVKVSPPELPREDIGNKNEAEEGPPPLPPLPIEEENSEDFKGHSDQSCGDGVSDKAEREDGEGVNDSQFYDETSTFEIKGAKLYLSLGLVAIGVVLVFIFMSNSFESVRRPYQVSSANEDALLRVAERPFNGRVSHRLRPTKDYSRLWLAANFPYDGVVFIKMHSIKGKTLSGEKKGKAFLPERISLQAQALLKGRMAFFDELEILVGDSLLPGFYKYEIIGKRTDLMAKINDYLKDKPLFREMSFTQEKNQSFKVSGELLLSPLSENAFNKKLEAEKAYRERKLIRPLNEYKERYKTFIGLLERVENLYIEIMRRITKGRSIFMFEDRYNKEIGPMLTDLIGDSYRRHLSLLNHSPEQSQAYEDLNNYGKDIGLIASEMVTRTQKVVRLRRANTRDYIEYFEEKINKLKEKGRDEIRSIEAQLKELQ